MKKWWYGEDKIIRYAIVGYLIALVPVIYLSIWIMG